MGSPDDIYDRPATAFVMSFVGESARLPVRLQDGVPSFGGQTLSLRLAGEADGQQILHVRPSDLRPVDLAEAELFGTVHVVRRAGATRRAEVYLQPGDIMIEIEVAGRVPAAGDRVGFKLTGGRVFPKRS